MSIDRAALTPVFEQLADAVRERITEGWYPPDSLLPAEGALAAEFGVGRDAVRHALAVLRGEGLVVTERGTPSRVRRQPARTYLPLQPGDRVTSRMPHGPEARRTQLDPGVPVLEIHHRDGRIDMCPADPCRPAPRLHALNVPARDPRIGASGGSPRGSARRCPA